MAASAKFNLKVLTEKTVIYFGVCEVLFVPYSQRESAAIMAHHTPTIMKLAQGKIAIRNDGHTQTLTEIKTGLLYVGDNEASVLVDL